MVASLSKIAKTAVRGNIYNAVKNLTDISEMKVSFVFVEILLYRNSFIDEMNTNINWIYLLEVLKNAGNNNKIIFVRVRGSVVDWCEFYAVSMDFLICEDIRDWFEYFGCVVKVYS